MWWIDVIAGIYAVTYSGISLVFAILVINALWRHPQSRNRKWLNRNGSLILLWPVALIFALVWMEDASLCKKDSERK